MILQNVIWKKLTRTAESLVLKEIGVQVAFSSALPGKGAGRSRRIVEVDT